MQDMVYQGTVWDPSLSNTFFVPAFAVINSLSFTEICYADDLNAFKAFDNHISNIFIQDSLNTLQKELHLWGSANQVTFDAAKESKHILSRSRSWGPNFKILGILFDCRLIMADAVHECTVSCGWKLESLLRSRRFFCDSELVNFFKVHVLSFIEYRTAGIAHASASVLAPIDRIFDRFLRQLGISIFDALVYFNLVPLYLRRDIVILGVIYRTVLEQGFETF